MRMVLKLTFVKTPRWAIPQMIRIINLDLQTQIGLTMKNQVISSIFTYASNEYIFL